MSRFVLALVFLGFLSVPLHAQPSAEPVAAVAPSDEGPSEPPAHIRVTAPPGWQLLPGLSKKISQTADHASYFGDEVAESGALAYGRANRGALYLTWVDGGSASLEPEALVRRAFDTLHEAPYLASPEAGSTQETEYRERAADGLAEMRFEWAHMSNGTVNMVRALGYKDDGSRAHLAVAECVFPNDQASESRPLCEAALASLTLTATLKRSPLAPLAAPSEVGARAPSDFEVPELKTPTKSSAPSLGNPPSATGEILYQGPPPQKQDNKNRIIIAIGAVLLGIAFYLTTRSRGRSDEPEADEDEAVEADDEADADNEKGRSDG